MRHPYRTVAVALAAVVLLTSCSWDCAFHLVLTVTNAEDGEPVPGVTALLDTHGILEGHKDDLNAGDEIGSTGEDGTLTHDFVIAGYTKSQGPWYLKLKKKGFEPVVIDISPRTDAKKGGELNPLPVGVRMKTLAK
jgi:hypothetical protein